MEKSHFKNFQLRIEIPEAKEISTIDRERGTEPLIWLKGQIPEVEAESSIEKDRCP
jgi:hypothetical protein